MAISKARGRGRRGAGKLKLVRPRPVDAHVGARVRLRRTMLGMSQEKLAEALGLTFQQVQKYEHGSNRIGSSRLYELSKILDVPIQFFFDEMPAEIAATARGGGGSAARSAVLDYEPDTLAKRETLELVRAYYKIRHPKVRKKVFDLAKALAKSVDTD
jgi:transcriptional regulator with XRE-family HTH domain